MEKRQIQITLFSVFAVLLAISLFALLLGPVKTKFMFVGFNIVSLLILVLVFLYGLQHKKGWAYHYGFGIISLLIVVSLWWQMVFKTFVIQELDLSYAALNFWAIFNMLSVSLLILVLIASLYIQLKLKKALKK
jgi:hypothetical protein